MWSNLSLTTKGLILVALPLLCEVGFLVMLMNYEQEAEAEAQKAVQARKISDQVTKLTTDMYNLYTEVSDMGKEFRQGKMSYRYRPVLNRVVLEYADLDKETKNIPEINKAVRDSMTSCTEAKLIMDQAEKEVAAGNLDKVVATYEEKAETLSKILHRVLSQDLVIVAKHEVSTANSSTEKQGEIRKNVVRLSYFFLAVIAISTVVLFLLYFKTVVSRLQVMGDNASRLANNQELNDRLEGSDEIADLDLAFHQMADSLVEASRMKEELVGMLTHDLRTPLTFIQGCLDMMAQGMLGSLNERGTRLIKLANRNSFLMMGLINDLLDSQKIQASMMTIDSQEICVAELFEIVREIMDDWVAEHGISIKVQDTDMFVLGDQEKLCRVLLNLVSNAVKYSKEGDTITLACRPIDHFAELIVADQGPGIPKEMITKVFDRFQQVKGDKQAKKGSGLGLSICQDLVGLHGGRIWATSEKGQGTVFHFTLPIA